jgi:hypothetical protein
VDDEDLRELMKENGIGTFNASQYYWNAFRTIYCETKKTSFAHTNGFSLLIRFKMI